jgi:hypothetical protein
MNKTQERLVGTDIQSIIREIQDKRFNFYHFRQIMTQFPGLLHQISTREEEAPMPGKSLVETFCLVFGNKLINLKSFNFPEPADQRLRSNLFPGQSEAYKELKLLIGKICLRLS